MSSSSLTQVTERLAAVSSHLNTPSSFTASTVPKDTRTNTMAAHREPITCHILDTTNGSPAANVSVQLEAVDPKQSKTSFSASTNDDGRVQKWDPTSSSGVSSLSEAIASLDAKTATHWKLTFLIGKHFERKGVNPFFPRVEIFFVTGGPGQEEREHYHVPLLVGPFNYTTYRGS